MDDLALKTKRGGTLLTGDHVDDNWEAIVAAFNLMKVALLAGAVYITAAATDEDGLTSTLSNGSTIGPIPFSGTPMRILGPWMTGIDYRVGDILTVPWGSVIVALDHTSGVLADDIDDSRLQVLYRAPPDVQRFEALGTVTVGSRIIGAYLVTQDCSLQSAAPVLLGLLTPITGGGVSFQVAIGKVNVGGTTALSSATFAAREASKTIAIDADLSAGDALVIQQIGGATSTGGANLTMSVPRQIGHA